MKQSIAVVGLLAVVLFSGAACQRQGASSSGGAGANQLQRIFFDFDDSSIRSDAGATLEANASWIRSHSGARVVVEGHCDDRGTNEYNMALGDRRAGSAKKYLVNLGIDPSVLSSVSYGEERPLASGGGETAWSQNRRAEFVAQ